MEENNNLVEISLRLLKKFSVCIFILDRKFLRKPNLNLNEIRATCPSPDLDIERRVLGSNQPDESFHMFVSIPIHMMVRLSLASHVAPVLSMRK